MVQDRTSPQRQTHPRRVAKPCICERIKVARQTRGLTLQDVGDVLGIDGRHVHAWEAGRRNPGPKHLAKLAEVLGLDVLDLLPRRT